ncbi:MAG: hypothetical protein IJ338_02300 [Bacteroidaceae bacterium]|nr:hypothetical protein [Bacteroidaceae bacterium]
MKLIEIPDLQGKIHYISPFNIAGVTDLDNMRKVYLSATVCVSTIQTLLTIEEIQELLSQS